MSFHSIGKKVSLELFSGYAVFSKVAYDYGFDAWTLDYNDSFKPDLCMDIMDFDSEWFLENIGSPRVIWASPECKTFSVASMGHHWGGGKNAYAPKTREAEMGIIYAWKAVEIIKELQPKYFFIENPRACLRKMDFMQTEALSQLLDTEVYRDTIWQCRYGRGIAKPTDVFNNCPQWEPRQECHNGNKDHIPAPRGAKTGTQGIKGHAERSKIPYELAREIIRAVMA